MVADDRDSRSKSPSWNTLVAALASSRTPSRNPTPEPSSSDLSSSTLSRIVDPVNLSWRSLQTVNPIMAQGLANCGNMCFLNAVLQSIIHLPPFINLFAKLRHNLAGVSLREAPFLNSIEELFLAHRPVDKDNVNCHSAALEPIEPESLYEVIRQASRNRVFQGAQEDAQEFFTFLLDRLHEELLLNQKSLGWNLVDGIGITSATTSEDGEWMEMGRKKQTSVARTLEQSESPISFLFFGKLRSIVKRPGSKPSITTEPFHCISLDIQDDSITSLEDALQSMVQPERIKATSGMLTKQLLIERAPPLLVFQLKRFVFNLHTESVAKLSRAIAYPERLELTQPITVDPPSVYRLMAVCYHHGPSAGGGHYTCHVRQTMRGDDPWLFFDDSSIALEPLELVLKGGRSLKQTAYLLIYQRHKK